VNSLHPFVERLGISLPIIQAPMASVATPALAAAVSNAGGLGSLGLGASTVQQARKMIEETRALTGQRVLSCAGTARRGTRGGLD
jgi:nitronate monooxygenase